MSLSQPIRGLRHQLRDQFFSAWERAFLTDDGKRAAVEPLRGLLNGYPDDLRTASEEPQPYPELGRAETSERTSLRDDIVFITARFRSGSTLLWNLFRHLPNCTSYYEPFNERRWFDPKARGGRVDATHLEVEEYWREYDGLEELAETWDERWIDRHLMMEDRFHAPRMKRYIERMIERAPGRPVLQFNRVDFRLPWLRRNFPHAKIVHLFRHPRDQWCSALMDIACCPRDMRLERFEPHDKFYLLPWIRDLKYHFPFLGDLEDQHPYRAFYLLWKLSWISGRVHSDCSLCFENLVQNPEVELRRLFEVVRVDTDPASVRQLIQKPALGKWIRYADDDWFRQHESVCETTLTDFFRPLAAR